MPKALLSTLAVLLVAAAPRERGGARLVAAVVGALGGLVAGTAVALGVVVARVRFEENYLHSSRELLDWHALPFFLGPVVGIALGLAAKDALWKSGAGAAVGLLAGAMLGAALATAATAESVWRWSGGVMGAAAGVLIGAVIGLLALRTRGERRDR